MTTTHHGFGSFLLRGSISVLVLLQAAAAFQQLPAQHSASILRIGTKTTSCLDAVASRQKRVTNLKDWSKDDAGIQVANVLGIEESKTTGGLGLVTSGASSNTDANSVVVTVPASLALSVELPSGGPDDRSVVKELVEDRQAFRSLPWYAQFALYLHKLDKVSSKKLEGDVDLQPWLDSLPRKFGTPIHWTEQDRSDWLQYPHMVESVQRQEKSWNDMYNTLQSCGTNLMKGMSFDDFLWGCECARSRAFSGGYTGAAFNPFVYAFTLVLVTAYIGLNLGTLEQAANGAGLVFCASVLRDFVLPKFFKTKKYVICPVIDMANHDSMRTTGNVAYEFFANAYSLSTTSTVPSNSEVFISYGSRSNDQLLQYYGFVEQDNPHDTYVMPPLRDWDIAALEEACGGTPFPLDRLQKLDRAGLLGISLTDDILTTTPADDESSSAEEGVVSEGNPRGGVVLSRAVGIDPAVFQALRALVSNAQEWEDAGEAVGNFAAEVSPDNEQRARIAARTAIEMEIASKATTLDEDRELLKRLKSSKSGLQEPDELTAIMFRIEKKKVLKESLDRLL
mmetsp:Transcript_13352/g.31219  ORF Transcript_13352/g.31219 Transcript_13352/m.31219 type:complete len:565 (+) Transcript_13352:38-1732(+)